MEWDAEHLAPAIEGPNIEGLCSAVNEAIAPFNNLSADLQAALDLRPGVWDPARPTYHLPTMERAYGVTRVLTMDDRQRYKHVRMCTVARFSWGLWKNLLRVAGAAIDDPAYEDAPPDPAQVRVYCVPLIAVILLAPQWAPAVGSAELSSLVNAWVEAIQDVAGWGIMVGTPDEAFTLDIGPGLDAGALVDVVQQGP